MMPVLPFIEDTPENILSVVEAAATHGAEYIIPAFGVSVREGQREHFYQQLDLHFPGVRQQYEQTFGWQYQCPARNQEELARLFYDACKRLGLRTRVSSYPPKDENPAVISILGALTDISLPIEATIVVRRINNAPGRSWGMLEDGLYFLLIILQL